MITFWRELFNKQVQVESMSTEKIRAPTYTMLPYKIYQWQDSNGMDFVSSSCGVPGGMTRNLRNANRQCVRQNKNYNSLRSFESEFKVPLQTSWGGDVWDDRLHISPHLKQHFRKASWDHLYSNYNSWNQKQIDANKATAWNGPSLGVPRQDQELHLTL